MLWRCMQHEVMVTSGANQAFTNVVLTLLDASDRIVLFVPYYFNHLMAIQACCPAQRSGFQGLGFRTCGVQQPHCGPHLQHRHLCCM